jgi:hypothetical protein
LTKFGTGRGRKQVDEETRDTADQTAHESGRSGVTGWTFLGVLAVVDRVTPSSGRWRNCTDEQQRGDHYRDTS